MRRSLASLVVASCVQGSESVIVNAMQWNPHWECLSNPVCAIAANGQLNSKLTQENLDFANIVMLNEDKQTPMYKPKSGWDIAVTAKCDAPDSTVLVYNSDRWTDLGKFAATTSSNCMELNTKSKSDRAFAIQAFEHKTSSQKILVVGAHYPHPTGTVDYPIKKKLDDYMQQIGEIVPVLVMADVNQDLAQEPTSTLLKRLTGSTGVFADQMGPMKTCCDDDHPTPYTHEYDRVGLTGAATLKRKHLLFDTAVQQWAHGFNLGSFHKAVFASFDLPKTPVPPPVPPPVTPPVPPLVPPPAPPPQPMPSGSLTLRALQWMPGRDCFDDAAGCGNPAQARLRQMLTTNDVDLANIIGLSDTNNFQLPPRYNMITGQCPLATGKVDSASIIWNTDRWQWLQTEQNGCMVTLDHVYTIQRFKHVASSRSMLVVGANYPHGIAADDVDAEIVKALQGILDPKVPVKSLQGALDLQMPVLFMANTNLEPLGEGTTDAILKRLTHRSGASVGDAMKTCCGNEVPEYTHSYDRIGLTGGSDPHAYPQPAHGQLAMMTAPVGVGAKIHVHKPLLASFTLAVQPPQPVPPHPVPPHPVPGGKLTLQALQWNPHWEVFSTPACAMAANNQLDIVLEQFQVDFANIVMLNEDQQHPQYKPRSGWDIAVTSKCEAPDSTVLIYNSDRWIDLGMLPFKETTGMCMVTTPKSDRPFATQVFKHKVSSQKILVVGAHYPHPSLSTTNSDGELKRAIELEMQRMKETGQLKETENLPVLFMADTNVEATQESTQSFLRRLTGRDGVAALPQNGQWKTCCDNDGYHHEYDRIGLTGPATVPFSGLLFNTAQDRQWASGCNIGSFHKAVVASFELQQAPPSPPPSPPKPPNPPYREGECGVKAMTDYKNTFGRRCSAVETNSGQCMFDFRSSEGRPCSGFFCNANGVDGDCAWCVYNLAKCNSVYTDGSCNHARPMCRDPTLPQVQEVTV